MAEGKKSFQMYTEWSELFNELENEEAGLLIKHIFNYVNDLNPVAPDRITKNSFILIRQQLKRDLKKWEAICERNKANIDKRWNTKNTTGKTGIPLDTRNTDKDKDKEKDKENSNIPAFNEFKIYALSKKPHVNLKDLEFKYQSWIENNWSNGNGKKILNWKSSLLNTLPFINETKNRKQTIK